jgi:hypothetical protein
MALIKRYGQSEDTGNGNGNGNGNSTTEIANTYADEIDLDSYADLRNIDLSIYSTAQKEAALYIAANDYIDGMHDFIGVKLEDEQVMKLYTDLVTYDDASKDIISVNCEAAILQLKGALFVEQTAAVALGQIKSTTSKLDVLEKSVEYVEGTARTTGTINTSRLERILRPYLAFGGGSILNMRF